MRAKAHLLMVIAALAARDAALARVHLQEAASVLDAKNPIDITTYEFQRGLLMMPDHDWRSAAQLMRSAVDSGRASGWPLREHIALLGQTLRLRTHTRLCHWSCRWFRFRAHAVLLR